MSNVARDITERKRAEKARQASEARYRTLFDYAPDGILIADRESYYIDANPSMCRMLGYSRDELIGLHASDVVVEEEVEHIEPALRAIAAASDYHREWQFRRKDGSAFAADVIATAMPDGNLLGMVRDATERNKAIEALRAAEERMRFTLQSADVGIWDMDYATGRAPLVRDPGSPVRPAARHVWRDLRGVRRAHSSRRSGARARDGRATP